MPKEVRTSPPASSSARVSSCHPAQSPYFPQCPCRAHTWNTRWPNSVFGSFFLAQSQQFRFFFICQATPDDSKLARGRPNGSHCSVKSFFRVLADREVPSLVHQLHTLTLDLTFQENRVSCCHLVERKTSGNLLSIHCPVKLLFLRRAETHLPC